MPKKQKTVQVGSKDAAMIVTKVFIWVMVVTKVFIWVMIVTKVFIWVTILWPSVENTCLRSPRGAPESNHGQQ